ncbi:MAG: ATP-grasp domain-containing protein [Actinomycetota bacterium]|nr:ATP-grasp domain-containing protein [Actinomycetota bacterium]
MAAARGLADAGWFVGVGAPGAAGLAAASRACRRVHDVPAAHEDVGGFIRSVAEAVRVGGYEVVFGAGEAEVMALSADRVAVPAVVPYAPHDAVTRALDKVELDELARRAGFDLPPVVDPATLDDPSAPVVVKARRHAAPETPGAPPRVDTNVVFGAAAARERVRQIGELGAEARVQEYLAGPLLAYAAVTDRDATVVADSMQLASKIWPPYAGASCRAATIKVDETVAARAQKLFRELGWFGLAELQFVVPSDGTPRLIDLNGRFYGSLALAAAAGVNLPATWAALATGRPVERDRARPGVRYQWLEGDLHRAVAEREGGAVRDVAASVAASLTSHHSLWRITDPAPATLRLKQLVTGGGRLTGDSTRGCSR